MFTDGGDEHDLALCDACGESYHTYCHDIEYHEIMKCTSNEAIARREARIQATEARLDEDGLRSDLFFIPPH